MKDKQIKKASIPFLIVATVLGIAAIIIPDPTIWIPLTAAFIGLVAFWWGMYYADRIITKAQRDK